MGRISCRVRLIFDLFFSLNFSLRVAELSQAAKKGCIATIFSREISRYLTLSTSTRNHEKKFVCTGDS